MADSEQESAPPQAPPPPLRPATLGELLRTARLMQDLTIEQLSTELRIEAKHLTALEENRFERIGVPVFVRGYLKQYGLRLGLDVNDLLALYHKQTTLADVEIQPSRTIKLHDDRQVTSWVFAAVVLIVVIAGLGYWWWSGGNFGAVVQPSTPTPPPQQAPEERNVAPAPAAAGTPREAPAGEPPASRPEVVATPESSPAAAPAAPTVAALEQAAADDARAAPVVAVPLQFAFDGESWAEVTDARGERLLFGLNAAGRTVTVSGEPPFAIVLGNADSVRLTVDGEPYEIPRAGRQGNLARFAVDIAEE